MAPCYVSSPAQSGSFDTFPVVTPEQMDLDIAAGLPVVAQIPCGALYGPAEVEEAISICLDLGLLPHSPGGWHIVDDQH